MSAVSLTVQALMAQSSVTAVVGTNPARIYPRKKPMMRALPAIAVRRSGEQETYLLQGASQYPESDVLVDCIAESMADADALGEIVKFAMQDLLYVTADSPSTYASFKKAPIDYDDDDHDRGTSIRTLGFTVRWR